MNEESTTTLAGPSAAASELPLEAHQFVNGVCQNPDVIVVDMPEGFACELYVARAEAGYFGGFLCTGPGLGTVNSHPSTHEKAYAVRAEALASAFDAAQTFFDQGKRPSKALKALRAWGENNLPDKPTSSPANKRVAAPLPEPKDMLVDLDGLEGNPANPRGEIADADVAELAQAIASVGLLQPVGVRLIADGGLPGVGAVRKQLLWGHRRAKAFRHLGRAQIPARVYEGISDEQARLLLLIENGQRKDLDPIQEARGYAEMMRDFEMTQDDVAKQVKKSRPVVANAMRLLELPESVQSLLAAGKLTTAHGVALCRFKDRPALCEAIAKTAVRMQAPASELEKGIPFVDELTSDGVIVQAGWQFEPTPAQRKDPDYVKPTISDCWICLNPEKFKADQKERAKKTREQNAKLALKEKKQKAEKKVYYGGRDGIAVDEDRKPLLALVPDFSQLVGFKASWDNTKCVIVNDRALWSKLSDRFDEISAADVKEKIGPIIDKAWDRLRGLKKCDGFGVTLMLYAGDIDIQGLVKGAPAKKANVDLGARAKKAFPGGQDIVFAEALTLDPVEIIKAVGAQLLEHAAGELQRAPRNWYGNDERRRDVELVCFIANTSPAEAKLLTPEEIVEQMRAENAKQKSSSPGAEAAPAAKAKKGGKKK